MKTTVRQVFTGLFLVTFVLISCKKNNSKTPYPEVITFVSPLADSIGGVLTITGNNFIPGTSVSINGIAAVVNSITPDAIKVTVPPNATTGKIAVTVNGVSNTYPVDFTVVTGPYQFYMTSAGGMVNATILMSITGIPAVGLSPVIKINGVTAKYTTPLSGGFAVIVPPGTTSGKVTIDLNGKTYTDANFKVVNGTFTMYSNTPTGVSDISFDGSGNLYGTSGNKVIKITPAGAVSTIATIGNSNTVLAGCVTDKVGNVYVSAPYDNDPNFKPGNLPLPPPITADDLKIYKITPAGIVTVLAGSNIAGYVDGQGASAQFKKPTSLAIDATGNIYVSDWQLLRKISPAGVVSTIAGYSNANTVNDGQGTAASFNALGNITTDATGNIYAADGITALRKITPTGQVTTIPTITTDGLPQVLTFLNRLAIDPSGNMYIDVNGNIYFMDKNDLYGLKGIISNTYLNPVGNTSDILGMAIDGSGNIYISTYATDGKYYIVKVMH